MTYLLILIFIILSIVSWNLSKKSQGGKKVDQNLVLRKLLGNELATICWGAITFLSIVFSLFVSDMGPRKAKVVSQNRELNIQRMLGRTMAEKLVAELDKDSNALVINRIAGEKSKQFHNAFMVGFQSGNSGRIPKIYEELIEFDKNRGNTGRLISGKLTLYGERFDGIVTKYADVSVVISLVGIPPDFEKTQTWVKASNGELFVVTVTNNPFLLGGMLTNREILGCFIPKRLYQYQGGIFENENLHKIFHARYWYVNADNIIQTMRKDDKIFKVTQRF